MRESGSTPAQGSWPDALAGLSRAALSAEDALFATVPVLGEPLGQRSLDAWVDQCVDVLRAIADLAEEILDRRTLLGLDELVAAASLGGADSAIPAQALSSATREVATDASTGSVTARSATGRSERGT